MLKESALKRNIIYPCKHIIFVSSESVLMLLDHISCIIQTLMEYKSKLMFKFFVMCQKVTPDNQKNLLSIRIWCKEYGIFDRKY
jgi:hypothetical protein